MDPDEIRTHDLFHAIHDMIITHEGHRLKTQDLRGLDLVPVGRSFGVSTHVGPIFWRMLPQNPRQGAGAARHVLHARARSFPPPQCSRRFVKQETKTRVFPIHADSPRLNGLPGRVGYRGPATWVIVGNSTKRWRQIYEPPLSQPWSFRTRQARRSCPLSKIRFRSLQA